MTARRLLAALLLALAGSALFTFFISRHLARPVAAAPQQRYVASINPLDAGQTLDPASLTLTDWPAAKPLAGAFAKPEQLAGRVVLYPLSPGQPILERDLAAAGSGVGLTTHIPEGMRAISLKTDQVVGVAGFLLPGTHVDVLVTYRTQDSPNPVTATVVQDTQVIAAGQKMQPDPEGKPTTVDVVTLLVTPQDAERVVLASSQGTVHFVLRNGTDHQHVEEHATGLSELGRPGSFRPATIAAPAPHRAAAPAAHSTPTPTAYVVHTLSGNKQSAESF